MKLYGTLAFGVLFLMISQCDGHIGGSPFSVQDIEPQVYCGRALSKALGLICFGVPINDKRALSSSMYNSILSQYYKDQETESGWPWIHPHRARSTSHPSRDKRFVVTECCDKACSVSELMSYC